MSPQFYNPFNFVPFGGEEPPERGRSGRHDLLEPDKWTGVIPCRLTAVSPLLLMDDTLVKKDWGGIIGHKLYPNVVREPGTDRPLLAVTSLKGALRAAYEAITSSRVGVWAPQNYKPKSRTGSADLPDDPLHLVPHDFRRCSQNKDQSPADRVFGWVAGEKDDNGGSAARGFIRIRRVKCSQEGSRVVETFAPPLTLAILGSPKPSMSPFYSSYERATGSWQARGRKVYLRQAGPRSRWDSRQPQPWKGTKSNQNRSIGEWIRPGAVFDFEISFWGLSDFELGALLWLLALGRNPCLSFGIGLGKPLGFGQCSITVRPGSHPTAARSGAMAEAWLSLAPASPCDPGPSIVETMKVFWAAMGTEQRNPLKAFLAAHQFQPASPDIPIRYPARIGNNGKVDQLRWFQAHKDRETEWLPDLEPNMPPLNT